MSMSFHVSSRAALSGLRSAWMRSLECRLSKARPRSVAVSEREHEHEGIARGASRLRLLSGRHRRREHLHRGRATLQRDVGS
eukprot:scaffold71993_cov62-Phaeocystis_antarctica.AAC.1